MQMKLISLNLAGFKDWESRQQKIVDFVNEEDPDAVLLQEVRYDPSISAYSQSTLLNRLLTNTFPHTQTTVSKFYQPSFGNAYREGLATLSKYPISNSESLVLTKQAEDKHPRIIQNLDLNINGNQVGLVNIHLSNNQYSAKQLSEILDILLSRKDERIIAGDFNIFKLEDVKDKYTEHYSSSIDFKSYVSFPSENLTLDYILIPKKSSSLRSLETHDGLSDHNALVSIVELHEF